MYEPDPSVACDTSTEFGGAFVTVDGYAVDLADVTIDEVVLPWPTRPVELHDPARTVDVPVWYLQQRVPSEWRTSAAAAFACGDAELEARRLECYDHWMRSTVDLETFTPGEWLDLHPSVMTRVLDEVVCVHRRAAVSYNEDLDPASGTGTVITECLECGHTTRHHELVI
jgi:hypothetical protein